jgi:hypothetical protein
MSALRIGRPGVPVVLVREPEPLLTLHQERVLHLLRSYRGNRSRTARHLGVTTGAVQGVVRRAKALGVRVPPAATRAGTKNQPRELSPRCQHMIFGIEQCARRVNHPGTHNRKAAWDKWRVRCSPR